MKHSDPELPSFSNNDPKDVFLASGHRLYRYADLYQFQLYFLEQLLERDIDIERPVGFMLHSCDELVMGIASCWELGIPFVCFNPDATSGELKRQVKKLQPSILITEKTNGSKVEYEPELPVQSLTLDRVLAHGWKPSPKAERFSPQKNPDDIFGYFFTSGTSSIPKIVPLKRRQMLFAAEASAQNLRPRPNHYWLLCLPLNHVGGVSIILRSLLYGSGVFRINAFDQKTVARFLSENVLFQAVSLVPTMLKRLLENSPFQTHRNFQAILLGGGPSNRQLLERAREKGIPVISSYGMTETCAQIAANAQLKPGDSYDLQTSVGTIFQPNEIEIRDQDGEPVGLNSPGSIWLRGPQVFDGYHNRSLNRQLFDEQGWFNTGDYGYLNMKRQLFIESRRSDLIITGGENVSPTEVEQELASLEGIREAAVIGIPDPEWGERVVAVVVAEEPAPIDPEALKDKLKTNLSDFKIPKQIIQTDALPRTRTEKVLKNELKKLFE